MDNQRRIRNHRPGRFICATALLAASLAAISSHAARGSTTHDRGGTSRCASPAPVPAPAPEAAGLTLSASTSTEGCIRLTIHGATASAVTVAEEAPAGQSTEQGPAALTTSEGTASVDPAPAWSCDRLARTFKATEQLADGSEQTASTAVSTPSCATRLSARVLPLRLHRGHPVAIALTDRWELGGLRVHACLGDHPRACSAATVGPGGRATRLSVRASASGVQALEISDPYEKTRLTVHVRSSRPVLLATGDSEMQVLDDDLASDLGGSGGASVIGDARQSTAISSPFFFDWPAHAFGQVADHHPDVVAMFLGGNEGFRLGSANCCGADWSKEYAARVAGMMRAYRQHGAASVYWFLIPTPSREPFVKVVRAVNRGIESAAAEFAEGIHVFDLRPTFSPGGRYIDTLTHDGRTITVHESDGFHLSESADVIVAHMFVARLREEGVL